MTQQSIPINDATEEQLREFAQSYLGISVPANTKPETLRAKVRAAWSKDEIFIEPQPDDGGAQTEQQGTPPRPVTPKQQPPEPDKVRVLISRTDDAGGDQPVPLGVNGRVMLVPRGEEVDIPYPYYEVLTKAITHRFDPLPEGGINPVPRKVPLYPFQRIA